MRFLKFASLVACGLFTGLLSAQQFGGYITATGQHMSSISYSTATSPWSLGGSQKGSVSPLGFTVGGYWDFKKFGPAMLGVDLRGSRTTSKKSVEEYISTSAGAKTYEVLGGVRLSFDTHLFALRIRPYVQGSGGLLRSNYGVLQPIYRGDSGTRSAFGVHGFAGVDIKLAPVLDFRVEGGSGAAIGSGQTVPVQNYSAGIVFHTRALKD